MIVFISIPFDDNSTLLAPRVRQLNAQVIDYYELGFKNVHYKRDTRVRQLRPQVSELIRCSF